MRIHGEHVVYFVGERSSTDVLSASSRPRPGPTSVHRDGRSSPGHVLTRPAHSQHLSRLLVQAQLGRRRQTVETTVVRLRPRTALSLLLHRQDGEAVGRDLHLVPDDPGRVRRPRATVTQSAPRVNVLRQDCRTTSVPGRAYTGDHEDMDRCDLHWCRGLSAVP